MTATVEEVDIFSQRLEVSRISFAGRVVDCMTVATLARRPFEPYVLERLQAGRRGIDLAGGEQSKRQPQDR